MIRFNDYQIFADVHYMQNRSNDNVVCFFSSVAMQPAQAIVIMYRLSVSLSVVSVL